MNEQRRYEFDPVKEVPPAQKEKSIKLYAQAQKLYSDYEKVLKEAKHVAYREAGEFDGAIIKRALVGLPEDVARHLKEHDNWVMDDEGEWRDHGKPLNLADIEAIAKTVAKNIKHVLVEIGYGGLVNVLVDESSASGDMVQLGGANDSSYEDVDRLIENLSAELKLLNFEPEMPKNKFEAQIRVWGGTNEAAKNGRYYFDAKE